MAFGLGTAVGYLDLDISGFARGVDSALSDMDRLSGGFKTVDKGYQTLGSMATSAGTVLTAGLTAPITGFAAASVKAGTDFDSSMARVGAVSKATGENFQMIRDRAMEMGEKTRYSATEVSDAMYYMGLAGWEAQEVYSGIPGVLALGAASGEELSRVSDIVTDSLTAFGKEASDTSEFVNVLAEASRSSNTTVDQLGESFKYVGPVAGAFNYSLQDTAVALGIFANNGVKGSQAGTGLRQALNSLINPSEKAAAQMDKYGVNLFNADGTTKSLMTVMEELRGTFGGLSVDIHNANGDIMSGEEIMEKYGHSLPSSEMEKLTAMVQIFGVRALPGMLSVVNASSEDFYGLADSIYGAQDAYDGMGTAFGMQQQMMDNLQGDWYYFTSALGTAAITISDLSKGALRELLQNLTDLVNKFNEADPSVQKLVAGFAVFLAAIGPILMIGGSFLSFIGKLHSNLTLLSGAFSFVGQRIAHAQSDILGFMSLVKEGGFSATVSGLFGVSTTVVAVVAAIVAAIAVLVAAFVNLWNNNEEFRQKIIKVWDDIKAKFEDAQAKILEVFDGLGLHFENFQELMDAGVQVLSDIWNGFCELLAPIFVGAFEIIGTVVGGIVDVVVGIIEIVLGLIQNFKDGDWSLIWQGVGDVVSAVINTVIGVLDALGETIWNVVQTVANWFGADWNMSWDEAKQAVADAQENIVQKVSDLVGGVVEFFTNLWDNVVTIYTNIKEFIVTTWETIKEKVTTFVENVKTTIQTTFENIKTTITTIWTNIKTTISTVLNTIKSIITTVWNGIKSFITTVINGIFTVISTVWNTIKTTISTVINAIQTIITTVWNAIKTTVTNVVNGIFTTISTVWNNIKTTISTVVETVKSTVVDTFKNIWENITTTVNNIFDTISKVFNDIKDSMSDAIETAKENVVGAMQKAKDLVVGVWDGIKDTFMEVGGNIIQGIIDGIGGMVGKLYDSIKDALSDLVDEAKDALGIESPSTVARDEIGKWLPPGIAVGFESAMGRATRDMQNSLDAGMSSLQAEDVDIVDVGFGMRIDDFVEEYRSAFEGLVIWFETMEERMANAIESLADYFKYLMYVRQILNNDDEFRTFLINSTKTRTTRSSQNPDVYTPEGDGPSGGDTFIFNSPKPIDEVQAARMLRNTKRDLAEGF